MADDQIINNFGLPMRGTIKHVSVRELLLLHEEAAQNGWTGRGRPAWLSENTERLADIYVTLHNPKHGRVRCYVMATFADGPAGFFTLDMAQSRFDSLKDLPQKELVVLAHRYL